MVMYGWLKVAFSICCLGKTCGGIFCQGKTCHRHLLPRQNMCSGMCLPGCMICLIQHNTSCGFAIFMAQARTNHEANLNKHFILYNINQVFEVGIRLANSGDFCQICVDLMCALFNRDWYNLGFFQFG